MARLSPINYTKVNQLHPNRIADLNVPVVQKRHYYVHNFSQVPLQGTSVIMAPQKPILQELENSKLKQPRFQPKSQNLPIDPKFLSQPAVLRGKESLLDRVYRVPNETPQPPYHVNQGADFETLVKLKEQQQLQNYNQIRDQEIIEKYKEKKEYQRSLDVKNQHEQAQFYDSNSQSTGALNIIKNNDNKFDRSQDSNNNQRNLINSIDKNCVRSLKQTEIQQNAIVGASQEILKNNATLTDELPRKQLYNLSEYYDRPIVNRNMKPVKNSQVDPNIQQNFYVSLPKISKSPYQLTKSQNFDNNHNSLKPDLEKMKHAPSAFRVNPTSLSYQGVPIRLGQNQY